MFDYMFFSSFKSCFYAFKIMLQFIQYSDFNCCLLFFSYNFEQNQCVLHSLWITFLCICINCIRKMYNTKILDYKMWVEHFYAVNFRCQFWIGVISEHFLVHPKLYNTKSSIIDTWFNSCAFDYCFKKTSALLLAVWKGLNSYSMRLCSTTLVILQQGFKSCHKGSPALLFFAKIKTLFYICQEVGG